MNLIQDFCRTLYNCCHLPLHYYKHKKLELILPETEFPFDFAAPYYESLVAEQLPVSYLITKEFQYWGLVQNSETKDSILIGPIISNPPSPASIRNIMKEYGIAPEFRDQTIEFFQFTPAFSFHQFCSFLALFYRELFQEEIDIEEYLNLNANDGTAAVASLHSSNSYDAKEEEKFHNTYHYEQQYLDYIRTGNVEGLKRFFTNSYMLQTGQIADNSLRQAKNILIVAVTLATRCAIEGGLDIESAYQLSDIYIQEGEKMQDTDALYRLQYNMLLDFAARVSQSQIPLDTTADIYKCIQFIQHHTNQAISVSDVADYIGKSRSYVSRMFKKELGFSMNEFIMRCKLEEAKSLLIYTEKSLSEISNYLCFSSQSYFQNVFKKKYRITPNEYRKHQHGKN